MEKRALVIGINDYPNAPLRGCIPDAKKMHALLSKHGDGSPNFSTRLFTSDSPRIVSRTLISEQLELLLMQPADSAIFYFSGHGSRNILGGHLVTQDAKIPSQGYSFHDLHTLVMRSPVREIAIILDCCYAGGFGNDDLASHATVELREGVTIMAACQPLQLSLENHDGGIFTSLVVDALSGEAADITGKVTLPGIYNYADGLLTAWDQRPLFKAHISQMQPVRRVENHFPQHELHHLHRLFPSVGYELQLSPDYEPTNSSCCANKVVDFALLQTFRAANLVEPTSPHIHMYFAAMENGSCQLTPQGKFYWRMIDRNRL